MGLGGGPGAYCLYEHVSEVVARLRHHVLVDGEDARGDLVDSVRPGVVEGGTGDGDDVEGGQLVEERCGQAGDGDGVVAPSCGAYLGEGDDTAVRGVVGVDRDAWDDTAAGWYG